LRDGAARDPAPLDEDLAEAAAAVLLLLEQHELELLRRDQALTHEQRAEREPGGARRFVHGPSIVKSAQNLNPYLRARDRAASRAFVSARSRMRASAAVTCCANRSSMPRRCVCHAVRRRRSPSSVSATSIARRSRPDGLRSTRPPSSRRSTSFVSPPREERDD